MLNAPKQSLEHDSKPSPTISRAMYVVREHTRLTAGAPAPRGSSINEMRSPTSRLVLQAFLIFTPENHLYLPVRPVPSSSRLALALGTLIDDTMGKEKARTRAGGASSSTTSNAPTVRRAPHDETAARARTSGSSSASAEDVALSSWERSAGALLNALQRTSRARSKAMLAQTSAAGTSTAR